jgi:arylsulfatase
VNARWNSLAIAVLLLCACGESPPRPNIIIYLSDTLRQDHLELYGYERATSPNLREFARDGITFHSAFAPSSWTKASTASLLTGIYPERHGATSRGSRLAADARLISQYLKPLGYWNAALVTNPFVVEHWGFNRDYDEFHDLGEGLDGVEAWQDIRASDVHRRAFELLDNAPPEQPFFLYVHTIDAHGPNNPPVDYRELYSEFPVIGTTAGRLTPADGPRVVQNTVDMYDSEVNYLDHEFGRFVAGLKERGLYDDTVIWFVSDHGEEFVDHGRGGHGTQLYNETVKVPMLLKLPGGEHAGATVDTPVSLIDVLATTLTLLDEEPDANLESTDLLATLGRSARPRPLYFDLNLVSGPQFQLHVSRGVLFGRFKYLEEILPEPGRYLYDLQTDPGERSNLVETEPDLVQELSLLLREHRAQTRTGLALRVIGDKRPKGRTATVRVRTSGRFVEVEGFDLEAGDEIDFEPGAQEFGLRFLLNPVVDNVGAKSLLQDMDSVMLRVDPPDASVTIESLDIDGRPDTPLYLGLARERVLPPHSLAANDPALRTPDLAVMFSERERRPISAFDELAIAPGMYVVNLPGSDDAEGDIPADILERLKALGYISETKPR